MTFSFTPHVTHVKKAPAQLLKNCLFVKGQKCAFHMSTILLLSYATNQEGVLTNQEKVIMLRNWPIPTTIKGSKRFLVLTKFC